jgi:MFS family permease
MGDALAPPPRSSFARYWTAAAVSSFGSAVTAVAMPVLVVQLLGATPFEVGVVNAAQFVPYALLGLIAGVYTDRWRRKPVLVWASVGRALSLGVIPVLWLIGVLQIWILVVALLLFGAFSVFGFAATQSLLPRLVPRARLVPANARLDQADAAAQALGPAIGGGLVGLLGAPAAIPSTRSATSLTQHSTRVSGWTSPGLTPAPAIFAPRFATACDGHTGIARWAHWRRRPTSGSSPMEPQ